MENISFMLTNNNSNVFSNDSSIKSNKRTYFPSKARIIICNRIYEMLSNRNYKSTSELLEKLIEDINLQKEGRIKDISEKGLDYLFNQKMWQKTQSNDFKKYFEELVYIISRLLELNENFISESKTLNLNKFVDSLFNANIRLGTSNKGSLKNIVKEILDDLSKNFEDFSLGRIRLQKLYDNGKKRECSRCHQIKEYANFDKSCNRNTVDCFCKSCRLIIQSIRKYKRKLECALKIYSGKLEGKCQECDTNIKRLPALEFHHPDQGFKTINFGLKYRKRIDLLIQKLESEKVILLCGNCHAKQQTKLFNFFKDLILKQDVFNYSAEKIESMVFDLVKVYPFKNKPLIVQYKKRVIGWIKKRYIIEQLFNGRCIGCGKVSTKSNLPSFEFHHRSAEVIEKRSKWEDLINLKIPTIVDLLIKEDCVALCANCHSMLRHVNYINNLQEIFQRDLLFLINDIISDYKNILINLENYKFPRDKILNPLKKKNEYGEAWKKYLLFLYDGVLKSSNQFDKYLLLNNFEITDGASNLILRKLIELGYIEIVKKGQAQIPAIYRITENGINRATQLKSEFDNLFLLDNYRI